MNFVTKKKSNYKRSAKQKELAKETSANNSYDQGASSWFPGHMSKAMNRVRENLGRIDIVIEVRDARAPLLTSNKPFTDTIQEKPRLVVYNKTNLAKPEVTALWKEWLAKKNEHFIFINALDKKSATEVLQRSKEILNIGTKVKMVIIGLPNTGKSSIINMLSGRTASKVADKPGQTHKELWIKSNASLDILDTPGVMPPVLDSRRQALQLSALNTISERIMDKEDTACFIIENLLENNAEELKAHYKIENLTNDLVETLNQIAQKRGCIFKKNEYDYERVYKLVINDFRKGFFGPVSLEQPPKV
jgi:ribosome biogenesis GTPase A